MHGGLDLLAHHPARAGEGEADVEQPMPQRAHHRGHRLGEGEDGVPAVLRLVRHEARVDALHPRRHEGAQAREQCQRRRLRERQQHSSQRTDQRAHALPRAVHAHRLDAVAPGHRLRREQQRDEPLPGPPRLRARGVHHLARRSVQERPHHLQMAQRLRRAHEGGHVGRARLPAVGRFHPGNLARRRPLRGLIPIAHLRCLIRPHAELPVEG